MCVALLFVSLDNPEKAQYSPSEVRCMGGADFYTITNLPTDDIKLLGEIFAYIQENEIYSLAELLTVSQIYHPEWFSMIAMSRCYVVDKFIKSLERRGGSPAFFGVWGAAPTSRNEKIASGLISRFVESVATLTMLVILQTEDARLTLWVSISAPLLS